jgi:hypothetical protein
MQTALPYVDDFLAGNSLASLEELVNTLDRVSQGASDQVLKGKLRKEEDE